MDLDAIYDDVRVDVDDDVETLNILPKKRRKKKRAMF